MLWWIIGALVALPVLWFAFTAIVGRTVSPEVSGAALLRKTLKARGIDPSSLSGACVDEIVAHSISMARLMDKVRGRGFLAEYGKSLDLSCTLIHSYLHGQPAMKDEPVYEILQKYGYVN